MNREKKEVPEIAFTSFLNLTRFPADNGFDFSKYLGFFFSQRLGCLRIFKNTIILHIKSNAPQKHIMWERSKDGFVPYESCVVLDTRVNLDR